MIDLSFLKEITGNDPAAIVTFLQDFLNDKEQFEGMFAQSRKEQDHLKVRQAAHYFASSAKVLGISTLQKELETLETLASRKEWTAMDEKMKVIRDIISTAGAEINMFLNRKDGGSGI